MSAQVSFGQGLENFDTYPYSSTSYSNAIPDWIGVNGITWSLDVGAKGASITGITPLIGSNGKNGFPKGGILTSSSITKGVGNLSFKYKKAFSSNSQISIYINDILIESISAESTDVANYSKEINVDGDFTFKFQTTERTLIDDIEWTAYGSAPVQSSAKTITSFVIDSKAGTLNEGTHTIGVTLPESTNVTTLSPVIEISDKATVLPASGASQDFTNPVTYTVTAEDGSSQEYVVTVNLEVPVVSNILINELDCDQAGTDTKEFVELYDGGAGNTSLDGYTLVFYNGSNDLSYATYDLAGQTTNAQGFFVIGSTEVANVNLSPSGFSLQNGADAVALYKAPAADFPNNTAVTTENLVDFVAYDTDDADDPGLLAGIIEGGQINENASGDMVNHSIYRATDGEGGARNTTAFIAGIPTPGKSNASTGTAITVDLALSAATASEADQTIIALTATASEAVSESQTLDVNISGSGITAGDYTLSAAQFTFAAGESTASASLTIVDDADVEGTENMTVSITNPSSGIQLGTTVSAVLSIADNDSAGNDGTETSPFTINEALALSETSAEYYAYGYIVSVGTDFEAPFTNAYYISIADSQDETNFDHCLNLKLEAGANRDTWNLQDHPENLGKQIKFDGFRDTYSGHASFEGNSVIVNLSGEPTLTSVNLALSATTASEADQTVITLTATASEAVSESQTLDVNISGSGITAGDYTLSAAQFTFAAGESTASTSLTIVDDADVEGTENMTVSISNPSAGIQLGTNVSASISIADNDGSTGSILANYVYLAPETNGDGSVVVNLTPKEYVQTVSPSHHMGSVKIPDDYYSSAVGFNGTALREHIHTIIETGAEAQSYSTVWNMCEDGDQNPKDASQVWQMYIEEGIAKTAHVSGSTGWNREHTWAKSHGGFGTSDGPGTDGHHLRATDAQENSVRGSRDFADVAPGYTPPKSARGDVARMIFYMATRWDMTVDDQCKETESAARHGKLSDLLKWHEEDPVDPYEVRRNNVIYGYQHNRNPFVDHPELVQYIFGEAKAQEWNGGIGTEPAKIKIAGTLADFGMVKFGEESAVQTFTVSANSLTENVSITSPQHFQISKDGTNYSSSLALTVADGTIAETTISVKFVPESAVSAKVTGDLKITSGENSKSIAVSGTEGDPALVPLAFLHEDFETDTHSNWILKSEIGDRNWAITEFSSNKYMQMSAYKATGKVVSWLISPELDLDAYNNEKLTFKTKNGYFKGLALEVLISADYDGGDVSAATWQKLDAAIDERNNTAYGADFVESGDIDLSAYEGTAYIAFKYTGDGSSVTTTYQVDDVVVEGNKIPLTGSLGSNLIADLEFPFTEVGAVSEPMLYELNFDKIEGDISIQASDNYEISLDGSTYESKLSIDQTEVSPVLITVRFAPKTAVINGSAGTITHKAKAAESLVVAVSSLASTEIADASTLGRDKTLDIVSWNVEWFGSPTMSKHASSFDEQLTAVSEKIIDLDADIYAIQELVSDNVNGDFLQPLVEKLNVLAGEDLYAASMGARYSHDDSAPSTDYPAQRICYIYNQTTVSNLGDFSMFSDLYPDTSTASIDGYTGDASSFWASGRLPYLFEAEVFIDGMKENIKLVNIHAKCCQDSHSRKLADAKFLMNELNTNYSNDNLVILGDYNDYLEGSMTSGASSPYASWFETKDYFDHVITSSTNIDHITISNELYDEYQVLTNNTSEENVSISDHHPILLRLKLRSDKISKKSQTITFEALADKTFGDPAFELVASASSGLEVSFELISGPATLSGKELTLTGAGTVVVKAVQAGNENYEAAEAVSRTFTVNKASQDIAFAELTDKTFGDPIFELVASASSGLEVSFELVSGPATLSGKELTLTGAGTVVVKAVQAGSENYEAAESVSRTFTVNKASQDIAFAELTDKTYGDAAFELVTSASSGLEVSFELVSGPATLSGKELTLTGAGTVVVKAVQAGNENYEAAEAVSRTFTVNKASQDIAFAELTDKTFGDPAFELVASASSGLEVSFELVSGPATLSGKELTLTGAGTVVVKAVQAGNENYEAAEAVSRTFTVVGSKENQTITFVALADKTFGDPAFELVASASSGLEVSFELVSGPATLSGKELTLTGAGTVVVKAVQAGNENYEAAESVSRTFTVVGSKENQTITFVALADKTFGDPAFELVASASSGLEVNFELVSGPATLSGKELTLTGAGTVVVKAVQAGNENYEAAESVSRTFTVEKASQTITFEPIEGLVVVGEPIQLSAVSSEGLTVAFELLEGNGELNGFILTPTLPGEFKVRAHQDGNANIKSAEEFQFFTVSQPTGLKEIFEKIVKIYPNPSRDFVSIDLPDADVIKILILNSRGQVVKTIQPREKHRININDLVSGNYFISIQTDEFIVTKRLMVVR
ncbi:endonuclease [Labilibaculum euxinus]|nr:endonuclease [Labilibaculum euxinus]